MKKRFLAVLMALSLVSTSALGNTGSISVHAEEEVTEPLASDDPVEGASDETPSEEQESSTPEDGASEQTQESEESDSGASSSAASTASSEDSPEEEKSNEEIRGKGTDDSGNGESMPEDTAEQEQTEVPSEDNQDTDDRFNFDAPDDGSEDADPSAEDMLRESKASSGNSSVVVEGDDEGMHYVLYKDGRLVLSGTNISTPILSWNYTNVKTAEVSGTLAVHCGGLFEEYINLEKVIFHDVDTSEVVNMCDMFNGCRNLTMVDLSGFNTSKVKSMSGMFAGCSSLTTLDLSGFDTSNVTNMGSMFSGCESLTSLELSGFKTSNVTNMGYMFYGCENLASLDISGFDTANVTSMLMMFDRCYRLTALDLSGLDTSNVKSTNGMFAVCTSLVSLNLNGLDMSNVDNMRDMFYGCSKLVDLNLSGLKTAEVTDTIRMFRGCSSLTALDLSGFDTSNVTDMRWMFENCRSLVSLNLNGLDASNVTEMEGMFRGCSSLTSLDLTGFVVSRVEDMDEMFLGCSSLTVLDLGDFDLSNMQKEYGTYGVLMNCTSLNELCSPRNNPGQIELPGEFFIDDDYDSNSDDETTTTSIKSDFIVHHYLRVGCKSKMKPREMNELVDKVSDKSKMPTINGSGYAYIKYVLTDVKGKVLKNTKVKVTRIGEADPVIYESDGYGYLMVESGYCTNNGSTPIDGTCTFTVEATDDTTMLRYKKVTFNYIVNPLKYEDNLSVNNSTSLKLSLGLEGEDDGELGPFQLSVGSASAGVGGDVKLGVSITSDNSKPYKSAVFSGTLSESLSQKNELGISIGVNKDYLNEKVQNKLLKNLLGDISMDVGSISLGWTGANRRTASATVENLESPTQNELNAVETIYLSRMYDQVLQSNAGGVLFKGIIEQMIGDTGTCVADEYGMDFKAEADADFFNFKCKTPENGDVSWELYGEGSTELLSTTTKIDNGKRTSSSKWYVEASEKGVLAAYREGISSKEASEQENNPFYGILPGFNHEFGNETKLTVKTDIETNKLEGFTIREATKDIVGFQYGSGTVNEYIEYDIPLDRAEELIEEEKKLAGLKNGLSWIQVKDMSRIIEKISGIRNETELSTKTYVEKEGVVEIPFAIPLKDFSADLKLLKLSNNNKWLTTTSYEKSSEYGRVPITNDLPYTTGTYNDYTVIGGTDFSEYKVFEQKIIEDLEKKFTLVISVAKKGFEMIGDAVDAGQWVAEKISDFGHKRLVSIITVNDDSRVKQQKSMVKVAAPLALDSEIVFENGAIVGKACYLSVSENDVELDDFSDDPLKLTVSYDDAMLADVGATDHENDLKMLHFDNEKCDYVEVQSTLNTAEKCCVAEVTKPGEYCLAVVTFAPIDEPGGNGQQGGDNGSGNADNGNAQNVQSDDNQPAQNNDAANNQNTAGTEKKVLPVGTEFTSAGKVYRVTGDDSLAVVKLEDKKAKTCSIPSSVVYEGQTYSVKEVGSKAFKGMKKLKSATIPSSVTKIGSKAFYNCPNLKKVTVKASSELSVGKSAFKKVNKGCTIKVKGLKKKDKKAMVDKIKKQTNGKVK